VKIDLPKHVADRIGAFRGRRWLLGPLLEWWEQSVDRIFLLTGDPGTGKSMILAWLAGFGPLPAEPDERASLERLRHAVKGAHFCQASSRNITPQAFADSVANQLVQTVGGYGAALADVLADRVSIIGIAQSSTAKSGSHLTGVSINRLDLSALNDEASFDRAFSQPLKRLHERGYTEQLLLLVDALDEAQTYSGITLSDLIARSADLPQNVRILASSRDEPRVLKFFRGVAPFDLRRNAVDHDDVRSYVEERLEGIEVPAAQGAPFAERLTQRADGVFLYAAMVLDELLRSPVLASDLDSYVLPKGLSGLYHAFLTRELGKDDRRWFALYEPLLGLIAVAQGNGLTATQLQQLVGCDVREALRAIKQYVAGDLPNGPFRPFHKSFADFLLDPDDVYADYRIVAKAWHDRIATHYMRIFANDRASIDAYGLNSLCAHLVAAGRVDARLIRDGHPQAHLAGVERSEDLSWLLRQDTEDGRNAWYELKAARCETPSYLQDIDLAWRYAESAVNTASSLGLQVRYALVNSTINSVSAKVPPALLKALVREQIWTSAQAITAANRIPDAEQRVRALLGIADALDETTRQETLAAALRESLALPDGDFRLGHLAFRHWHLERPKERWFDRAAALVLIAPHLPEPLFPTALEGIRTISSASNRAAVLAAFLPVAAQSVKAAFVDEALRAYQELESVFSQASMVASLLAHLDDVGLATLLESVARIDHDASKSHALERIAEHLPPSLWPRASEIARGIGWQTARLEALCKLLMYIPDSSLDVVAEGLLSESQPDVRARCLLAIAPRLDEQRRAIALRVAFEDIGRSCASADGSVVCEAEGKVFQLTKIVEHAAGQLKSEATTACLTLISTTEAVYRQAEQLRDLAQHCSSGAFADVLEAAAAIKDEEWRAHAIQYVAPWIPNVCVARALAIIMALQSEYYRFTALESIGHRLSSAQWAGVLATWDSLDSDHSRGKLVQAITKAGIQQVIEALLPRLEGIVDVRIRWEALLGASTLVPQSLAASLVAAAFEAAKKIASCDGDILRSEADLRFDAFQRLLGHLSGTSRTEGFRLALSAARALPDTRGHHALGPRCLRPEALVELLKYATDNELELLLTVAVEVDTAEGRAKVFESLAYRLPRRTLERLLRESLAIGDVGHRIRALFELALHFPEDQRSARLLHVLAILRTVASEDERGEILRSIVETLPAALLGNALAIVSEIQDGWQRLRAVFSFVHRLSGELLARALDLTDDVTQWELPDWLLQLAENFSGSIRDAIVQRAIRAASRIEDQVARAEQLARVALQVDGTLGESVLATAVGEAMALPAGAKKAMILAPLLGRIPDARKAEVLRSLGASVRAIPLGTKRGLFGHDETRSHVIDVITPFLSHASILDCFADLGDLDDPSERCASLLSLSSYLPPELRQVGLRSALIAAGAIGDANERASMLTLLGGKADFEGRDEALLLAFQSAMELRDPKSRAHALVSLLNVPTISPNDDVRLAAFEAARRTQFGEERAKVFVKLAASLDDRMWTVLLKDISGDNDGFYQAVMLCNLAPWLPAGKAEEALAIARSIPPPFERAIALGGIARCLPPDKARDARREALGLVSHIDDLAEVWRVCEVVLAARDAGDILDAADAAESCTNIAAGCTVASFSAQVCDFSMRERIVPLATRLLKGADNQASWWQHYVGLIGVAVGAELEDVVDLAVHAVVQIRGRVDRLRAFEDLVTAIASRQLVVGQPIFSRWLREIASGDRHECLSAIAGKRVVVQYVGSLAKELGREGEVAREVVSIGALIAKSGEGALFEAWSALDDTFRWWP
jgi:hypothetical protein